MGLRLGFGLGFGLGWGFGFGVGVRVGYHVREDDRVHRGIAEAQRTWVGLGLGLGLGFGARSVLLSKSCSYVTWW